MQRRLLIVAACAALFAACGQSETTSPPVAASNEKVPQTAPPPTPRPNFLEEEEGTYFYVTAVSEEDQKKGKAVGDVVGFRYFGKNDKGQHVLGSVQDAGRVVFKSYCSDPCAIIKDSNGTRTAFDSDSIIGAAFQDAINGFLKPVKEKSVESPPNYPRTVSSIPKTFQGPWDELTQDGCAGRHVRFVLDATKLYNFEIEWDVTKVDLLSANEIDLHTTTKDDDGGQVNEVWRFKLTDNGKSLVSREPGGPFYRRCPSNQQ
jgi:hypothetical protein